MFAKQLKYLRQSKQLKQETLGNKLGVTKQSISNWENDNITPSVEMLAKIADFFDVSTDYLLGREKPANEGIQLLDITGLTPVQIEHIRYLVDDLRDGK